MMNRKMLLVSAAVVLMTGTPVAAQVDEPSRLTIASGPISGGWYPMAGVFSELIQARFPETNVTVTTGGGVENVPRVAGGVADIGFTQADMLAASVEGRAPYETAYEGVAALGYLGFVPQAYFLVPDDADYQSIEQIIADQAPVRLVVPPRNNGGELIIRRLLAAEGVTYEDIESWGGSVAFLGYGEVPGLIADGHADAYVGPVIGAIRELITQQDMRWLPWPEETIDAILDQGYERQVTPAGQWYFVAEDTAVPALTNILVVSAALDDAVVGELAAVLAENEQAIRESAGMFQSFSGDTLDQVSNVPVHPGAAAYFETMN